MLLSNVSIPTNIAHTPSRTSHHITAVQILPLYRLPPYLRLAFVCLCTSSRSRAFNSELFQNDDRISNSVKNNCFMCLFFLANLGIIYVRPCMCASMYVRPCMCVHVCASMYVRARVCSRACV